MFFSVQVSDGKSRSKFTGCESGAVILLAKLLGLPRSKSAKSHTKTTTSHTLPARPHTRRHCSQAPDITRLANTQSNIFATIQYVEIFLPTTNNQSFVKYFQGPSPRNCWRCWIINGDSLILLYRLTYGAVLYLIVAIKNIDRKISTSRF